MGCGVNVGSRVGVVVAVAVGVEVGCRMAASVPIGHVENSAAASRQITMRPLTRTTRVSFFRVELLW